MTEQQQNEVKTLLKEIYAAQASHEKHMNSLRTKLLSYAAYFDTYAEMYSFIKKNTPTLKDFCLDMLDALPIFWNSRKGK